MSSYCHHAIIVTCWNYRIIAAAHEKALEIFKSIAPVTEVVASHYNGFSSFMVATDGSKENRLQSDAGDQARKEFIEWMGAENDLLWVEVQYANDYGKSKVLQCNSDLLSSEPVTYAEAMSAKPRKDSQS